MVKANTIDADNKRRTRYSISSQFNRGEFCESLEAFRKGIEACGNRSNDNAVKVYGEAPAIISLVYSGWILTIQGRLEEGLENGERAVKLARQCGYPLVTAFVSQLHCNILAEHRRPAACLALGEEALRFSREHYLVFWVAGLIINAGRARAYLTDPVAGVEQMRTGVEAWKNTGAALHLPTWGANLAEALLLADVTDEAATVLEDALALAYRNGDVCMLAELHRLRGRLHVRVSRVAEAETEFLRALEVGRQQEAKLPDFAAKPLEQGFKGPHFQLLMRKTSREMIKSRQNTVPSLSVWNYARSGQILEQRPIDGRGPRIDDHLVLVD